MVCINWYTSRRMSRFADGARFGVISCAEEHYRYLMKASRWLEGLVQCLRVYFGQPPSSANRRRQNWRAMAAKYLMGCRIPPDQHHPKRSARPREVYRLPEPKAGPASLIEVDSMASAHGTWKLEFFQSPRRNGRRKNYGGVEQGRDSYKDVAAGIGAAPAAKLERCLAGEKE